MPIRRTPRQPARQHSSSRRLSAASCLLSSFLPLLAAVAVGQPTYQNRGRLSSNPPHSPGTSPHGLPNRPGGEHLSQWMNRHSNLPLPDQQRALEREPGFRELSPEVQQRMRNRLTELNNMSPERRQHLIDRAEAVEHLTPQQRQQFRSTMQQLSSLAPDRKRAVSRAFRDYRSLPPEQRSEALRSGQLTGTLGPEERATFNSLVSVEPYLPPPRQLNRSPGGGETAPLPMSNGFQSGPPR